MFYDIVDEQIEVVGKALLGLTLQCARCHDHKFDPIRTRDYYSMASIFASTRQLEDWEAHVSKLYFAPLVPGEVADRYYDHQKKMEIKKQQITNVLEEQTARHAMALMPGIPAYLVATRDVQTATAREQETTGEDSAETQEVGQPSEAVTTVAVKHDLDSELLDKWADYLLTPSKEVRPHLDRWHEADADSLEAVARDYQAEFEKTATKRYEGLAQWREQFAEAVAKGEDAPERPRFFAGENRFFYETTRGRGPLAIAKDARSAIFTKDALEALVSLEAELEGLTAALPPKPPMANAVAEDKPVEQHVFISGNVRRLGEAAPKSFPVILTGENEPAITEGSGRMELARWLASAENPLTGSRDGEPHLAMALRRGLGPHAEQLRQAGRAAHPSRTARLPGRGVRPRRLVGESDASADCVVERLSDEYRSRCRRLRIGSGEPALVALQPAAHGGRGDS